MLQFVPITDAMLDDPRVQARLLRLALVPYQVGRPCHHQQPHAEPNHEPGEQTLPGSKAAARGA